MSLSLLFNYSCIIKLQSTWIYLWNFLWAGLLVINWFYHLKMYFFILEGYFWCVELCIGNERLLAHFITVFCFSYFYWEVYFSFFLFLLHLWHVEAVPGPGIEPKPQQWPEPLQCPRLPPAPLLDPLRHKRTLPPHFLKVQCEGETRQPLGSSLLFWHLVEKTWACLAVDFSSSYVRSRRGEQLSFSGWNSRLSLLSLLCRGPPSYHWE